MTYSRHTHTQTAIGTFTYKNSTLTTTTKKKQLEKAFFLYYRHVNGSGGEKKELTQIEYL